MTRHATSFQGVNGICLDPNLWRVIFFVVSLFVYGTGFAFEKDPAPSATYLRCEMLVNPIGIDVVKPRLSWEILSDQRNVRQTAYQVIVSSSKENLLKGEGDLWNSGKVSSDQSIHISYIGKFLQSRMECYWRVKVWTTKGESAWSEPAFWSMGLASNDWHAKWVGLDRAFPWDSADSKHSRLSARYFRKEFNTDRKPRRAMVYVVGLGLYELYINGKRIGNQVLTPVPTDYTQVVKFNSFDVTGHIKQGSNAVATVLGNGRYFTMRQAYKPHKIHTFGFPKMLLQLEVEYNDGTRQIITSDQSWKVTADGPIRTNNEYDGEEYDATRELPGWNDVGFDDRNWLNAEIVEEPGGKIQAQMNENMAIMESIKPISIRELKPGRHILDMGQNMVGWLKIRVSGKRGEKITLRFAETLNDSGELYTENLRDARVTDIYTLKGEGVEIWEPSFVYHGFRYVEVTGFPAKPTLENFAGQVVYDKMPTIGTFETSHRTINQIYKNAYWGIRGNYKGMPVDCPQRNERQPWLGDRATGAYGESFIFDNARLYAKWLDDIKQSQTAEGRIPDVAPNFWFYYKDNMTWPGTYLMVADMLYRQYGDRDAIEKHYPAMKQWLVFMQARYMDDYLIGKDSYGDWCVPPESPELIHSKDSTRKTDGMVIATAYYYYMLELMTRFATVLDKQKDIAEFSLFRENIRKAFNKRFLSEDTVHYSNGTVTANLLALSFGLVPEQYEKELFDNTVDRIIDKDASHISTGVIGTQWLMRKLTQYGRPDVAYAIASNRDYPSWGYMVERGATTIWELWNGDTANPAMNSHNHVMLLGDLIVWFYEDLAGIKSANDHQAFKKIKMKPSMVDGLEYVNASYRSMHGSIKSDWRKDKRKFMWNITIPANTQAIVYIPANSENEVRESGRKISLTNDIRFLRMEGKTAIYEIGSGNYSFSSGL